MTDITRIVSVDDHVVEPPDLWLKRLPARYREIGPRVTRGGQPESASGRGWDGLRDSGTGPPCDWWHYEDVRMPIQRSFVAVSYDDREGIERTGTTYDEMRPGCYDPAQRLVDMDQGHIEASLCFPNILPRFCGQTFLWAKDKELALLSVEAYNDWMVEEWCGSSYGRLIPLCLVPLWDAEAAATEVYRNAQRGARAITFSELPSLLGLPSIHDADRYWDPLFRACQETGTVICMHIGSSSQLPKTSHDAPLAVTVAIVSNNAMSSLVDWLFSGVFERFSTLRVAFSEAEIGWIPYILERADRVWETRPATYDRAIVPSPPSSYFPDHVFGCMVSDQHGIDSIESIGIDNVLFEVDYPHADSNWPRSHDIALEGLRALSEVQRSKILRGNAIRLFSLNL